MQLEQASTIGVMKKSYFDQVWSSLETGGDIRLDKMAKFLTELENKLGLEADFLADDIIITSEIEELVEGMERRLEKSASQISIEYSDMKNIMISLLKDIKVIDLNHGVIYGGFNDGYEYYQDNFNNYIYKETGSMSLTPSNYSLSEDDSDETASLMNNYSKSEMVVNKKTIFNLNEILEEINDHHSCIDESFHNLETRVNNLHIRNYQDLRHLNQLLNHNNSIDHRLIAIRSELEILYRQFPKPKLIVDVLNLDYTPVVPKSLVGSQLSQEDIFFLQRFNSKAPPTKDYSSLLILTITIVTIMVSYYFAI